MDESKWSNLPVDILEIIADRLNDNDQNEDGVCTNLHNLRLRSVCKSWRSSIFLSPPPPPMVVVSSALFTYYPENPTFRGNLTLSLSSIYLLQPQSSSSSYLLVKVEKNKEKKWRPLNQLSKVPFPKSINLLNFRVTHIHMYHTLVRPGFCAKVAASTSSSLLAFDTSFAYSLWFLELGDTIWRQIDSHESWKYADVIFHKGKFYVVEKKNEDKWRIFLFEPSNLKESEHVRGLSFPYDGVFYQGLVECNGSLYLTVKYLDANAVGLKIFKLNEEEREWERVLDLDNHVFFLVDDYSYSISSCYFPTPKTNYIYFHDASFWYANVKEENIGIFCSFVGVHFLDDGTCGPLANFPDQWPLFFGLSSLPKQKAKKK